MVTMKNPPVFLSLREKDVVYLAVIFFLLLLVMFNYDFPTDKIPSALYDYEIYKLFKEKYPDSIDEEVITSPSTYMLKSSYTKGNDTIAMMITWDSEQYFMAYHVLCLTDMPPNQGGGAYHEAFLYLMDNDCIKP